ncbi:MAG: ROK family protein [Aminobacteriaceae bacterium]|jgi:glucokinase
MRAIGIDLGGHKIAAALVEDGRIVQRLTEPTPGREPDDVTAQVAKMAGTLGAGPECPVGVGIPGMLDTLRETALLLPNFSGWNNLPVRKILSAKIGLPVEIENDANCHALGEGWGGAAAGMTDYVLFTLGTGIGGGIVINGRILRGFHGMAGEPGHLAVGAGEPCGCGSHGHLEGISGADALERNAEGMGLQPDLKYLWTRRSDPSVAPLWDRALDHLAKGIASTVHLLDPQAVILGGGLSRGEGFLDVLRPRVIDYLASPFKKILDLRLSLLGNDAAVIGAAALTRK